MSWTAPPVFVNGNVLTAAQMNVLTTDLTGTIPGVASSGITIDPAYIGGNSSSPGVYSSSAVNAISEMRVGQETINTAETTTSSVFIDLATVGPSVQVTANNLAIVFVSVGLSANTTSTAAVGWEVAGATTVAAANNCPSINLAADRQITIGSCRSQSLTAGINLFTMQYVVSAGTTGTFYRRHMSVWPF